MTAMLTGVEPASPLCGSALADRWCLSGCSASNCSTTASNGARTRSSFATAALSCRETGRLGEQALLGGLGRRRKSRRWLIGDPAQLRNGRAHYPRRGGGERAVLPAERNGQRQAAERGAAGYARAGMEFGEMAIFEPLRWADVWADTPVIASNCRSPTSPASAGAVRDRPEVMRNLSALLSQRLIIANAKVDLLSAY